MGYGWERRRGAVWIVIDGKDTVQSAQIGHLAVIGTIKGNGPLIDDGTKPSLGSGLGLRQKLGLWGWGTCFVCGTC